MSKREIKPHRLNLAIDPQLLETVRVTALKRFNAPLHHISGHPEISSTIIKLLELGLKTLSEDEDEIGYEDDLPISLKEKYEGLDFRFNSLAENLERLRERVKVLELELTHINTHIDPTKGDNAEQLVNVTESFMRNQQTVNNFVRETLNRLQTELEQISDRKQLERPWKNDNPDDEEKLVEDLTQLTPHLENTTVDENHEPNPDDSVVDEDDEKDPPTTTSTETLTASVETMNKSQMARYMKVTPTKVSNWVLNGDFHKFPPEWIWNPNNNKHGLFERRL